jgi:hypothetical protein
MGKKRIMVVWYELPSTLDLKNQTRRRIHGSVLTVNEHKPPAE